MIKSIVVAARDRRRLSEIASVATRFGLGLLLARLGIETTTEASDQPTETHTLPHRTRLALEALGPTFVKLGQILATRGDILPPEWIEELSNLHSRAPTLSFETLRPSVEAALGGSPERIFASFDPSPLAAASIAQVHRAVLHSGEAVVLKIRRPGIRPKIEADLRLIAHLAAIAEQASAEARRFAPGELVAQLGRAMLEELDFSNEGRNADRLREDFADNPTVVIPSIYWAWTSDSLLTMDYIDGIHPENGARLRAAGIDPAVIADRGANMVLDMLLVSGRFHGDPHPGNLLCLSNNRIALLDLGLIGHVGARRRAEFLGFMRALVNSDAAVLSETLSLWSKGSGVAPDRVMATAERLIARHDGQKLVLGALMADFMTALREVGLVMPPDLLLLFKALITIDGVLTGIEPDFDLAEAVRRSSTRILMARLSPDHWNAVTAGLAWELLNLGDQAPRLLRAAVRRLEQAEGEPDSADRTTQAIDRASRRISRAVMVAGALVASSIIAAVWLF